MVSNVPHQTCIMLENERDNFRGFHRNAAKKSMSLKETANRFISRIENDLRVITSTPKGRTSRIMAINFSKNFENQVNFHPTMDYDSGYISHTQESNSGFCLENALKNASDCSNSVEMSKPIFVSDISESVFISEDALQEKPEINGKIVDLSMEIMREDYEETRRMFNTPSTIVSNSVVSEKSICSDISSTSDMSIEITQIDPIIIENKDLIDMCSTANDSNIETNEITTLNNFENVNFLKPNDEQMLINNSGKNKRLTLVFSKENKENVYRVKRKYPSMTPEKKYKNPVDPAMSPDLFDDEVPESTDSHKKESNSSSFIADECYIIRKDQRILKRVQTGLSGVLPPPSVTVVRFSVEEMLARLKENTRYFWDNNECVSGEKRDEELPLNTSGGETSEEFKSLLLNVGNCGEFEGTGWPEVLEYRYHGLHHNRSKLSEEFESLCHKYAERFVGGETQSSCTVFETNHPSPSKRRSIKQRWAVKSPGRRLSHLARRRITFSSANLQAGGSGMGSRSRQILVDAKKLDLLNRVKSPRKTPKKTPLKSPRVKTRTPSSSAKKKLAMRFRKLTGEFEKNSGPSSDSKIASKRMLFTSPDKGSRLEKIPQSASRAALFQDAGKHTSLFMPSTSGFSSSENSSHPQPRRALFLSPSKKSPVKSKLLSPFKKSPMKRITLGVDKKRKRLDSGEEGHGQPSKFPRSVSVDLRPSSTETKTLPRTKSDLTVSSSRNQNELSDLHKKKLQWAVYEAMRSQNVTPTHPQFKIFASILARVTRRLLPNVSSVGRCLEGGTSERMLRIARHHVFAVVRGKSVEEIVGEYWRSRAKVQKPQGYVGPEEFNNAKKNVTTSSSTNKENVLKDRANTIESWEKQKLEQLNSKPKTVGGENKIDRIRKVINFGDDNR